MNWRNCVQPIFGSAKFTNAGIAYDSRQHQHPRALTIPLSIASKETNGTTDEFRRNDMREIEKKTGLLRVTAVAWPYTNRKRFHHISLEHSNRLNVVDERSQHEPLSFDVVCIRRCISLVQAKNRLDWTRLYISL